MMAYRESDEYEAATNYFKFSEKVSDVFERGLPFLPGLFICGLDHDQQEIDSVSFRNFP